MLAEVAQMRLETLLPMQWQPAITELSSSCLVCFHYSECNHKHRAGSPFHSTSKEKHMEEEPGACSLQCIPATRQGKVPSWSSLGSYVEDEEL